MFIDSLGEFKVESSNSEYFFFAVPFAVVCISQISYDDKFDFIRLKWSNCSVQNEKMLRN